MAALVFIVGSVCEQIYRIGSILLRSNGSIDECWNYMIESRQQYLIAKYLKLLDKNSEIIYNNKNKCFDKLCYYCAKRNNLIESYDQMMGNDDETFEFVPCIHEAVDMPCWVSSIIFHSP